MGMRLTDLPSMTLRAVGTATVGLACAAASACGGGGGADAAVGTDAFSMSGDDAGGGLALELPVASTGEMGDGTPDFACRGSRTAPTPGADIEAAFRLAVFGQDGQVARQTRVWFFPDNVIADACSGSCQEFTTGDDGTFSPVTVGASSWYAYRVFENTRGGTAATRYTDSVQYNELSPSAAGGEIEGNAVAFSTIDLIPLSLGLEREPGTTILAGRVQDCAGSDVGGAIVRAFRADGSEILDAGIDTSIGPHYRYFRRIGDDSNPSNEQAFSNYEGLYAAMNIPVTSELIRVETWGRRAGDAMPVLLGCEGIRTLADGVSIINVQPLRSDYPAGHPCARYVD
jgi:hypothetical protein